MNVLSLFDGMSCGQIALKELGVKVDTYYASEIDKYAIKQTQHNFPDTIQLGSVVDVKVRELKKIDLVIGGSPCQGFSFAGKRLNFDDPRSALFFEYVRVLNEAKKVNPDVKFLLENVNMKRNELRIISEYLGVFPVRINSNLVSAQNRDRWYWTNIRTKDVGLFSELWSDIPQPEDKGILLKDILEPEVDEKYYLSDKMINHFTSKPGDFGKRFNPIKDTKVKGNCINVSTAKMVVTDNYICVAMRGRNPENPSDRTTGIPTEQRLEPKTDGKTNCITSVSKDNLILSKSEQRLVDNIRDNDDKAQCLLSTSHKGSWANGMTNIIEDYRLRRLTPTECARLQTIPDWYKWIVSDTQIYKMLGNGWTVEVIKHIFSYL